jgi:hypothetical protein
MVRLLNARRPFIFFVVSSVKVIARAVSAFKKISLTSREATNKHGNHQLMPLQ